MRISTSQMFYQGTSQLINGQSDLYKTQNQLSTGRKILAPRDNPVESTQALLTTQAKEVNATFMKNQDVANDHLAFLDTQLGSVTELLQNVIERSVQGGNSTYSDQQKQAIAEELRRRFEGLIDLANSRDSAGEYVFSGSRTNQRPFAVSPPVPAPTTGYDLSQGYVSYAGDDTKRYLQVETTQVVPTSASGQEVFMRVMDAEGNLTGRSIFDSVKNMIDVLDASSGVTGNYDQALGDLHDALDHVARIRAAVGADMNRVDSLNAAGSDLSVQYESRLAKLEGLDYTEAISRLNQQQMQLQASQASFARTSQLSLFEMI